MEGLQQAILRMELQIGQLIRLVANLNERVEKLEQDAETKRWQSTHRSRLSQV